MADDSDCLWIEAGIGRKIKNRREHGVSRTIE